MVVSTTRYILNLGKKIPIMSSNIRKFGFIINPKKYVLNVRYNRKFSIMPKFKESLLLKGLKLFIISTSAVGISWYIAWQREIFFTDISCQASKEQDSKRDGIYESAINECRDIIQRIKDEVGAPGIVIGVSVDGKIVWEEGIGYADVENRVPCTANTVMRIASISKSITMAAVAKLWEVGKLDLDKPVQHYVPSFPQKLFDGEPVDITCRHLVSHIGGIRHYDKNFAKSNSADQSKDVKAKNDVKQTRTTSNEQKEFQKVAKPKEFEHKEYYIKDKYEDVKSALELFKNDPLIFKPGSKFHYSTHAWTLVSAIVEAASQELFPVHMKKLFKKLGMAHTYLDVNESLIYHRSRNYSKDKRGHLMNASYVDNSYKWAGGGFLSTVGDLLKFSNAMLYCWQFKPVENKRKNSSNVENIKLNNEGSKSNGSQPSKIDKRDIKNSLPCKSESKNKTLQNGVRSGFLKSKTVEIMWSPVIPYTDDWMYAMGWAIQPEKKECECCEIQHFSVYHGGAAVGASSIVLVLPKKFDVSALKCEWSSPPKGVTVAILSNLQEINFLGTAYKIAQIFNNHSCKLK